MSKIYGDHYQLFLTIAVGTRILIHIVILILKNRLTDNTMNETYLLTQTRLGL